jgi:hypothetical protein
MADAEMLNKAAWLRRIAAIPDTVVQVGEVSLDVGTDDLVEKLRAAAPVDNGGHDPHPGLLKREISKHRSSSRGLSWVIVSTARDRAGRLFGRFVEFGHGLAGPRPWWFPTYRAWKKPFRAKLYADTRKALKALWNGGV